MLVASDQKDPEHLPKAVTVRSSDREIGQYLQLYWRRGLHHAFATQQAAFEGFTRPHKPYSVTTTWLAHLPDVHAAHGTVGSTRELYAKRLEHMLVLRALPAMDRRMGQTTTSDDQVGGKERHLGASERTVVQTLPAKFPTTQSEWPISRSSPGARMIGKRGRICTCHQKLVALCR